MSDKDHEELIDMLLSLKGKWLLSGYDNPIYEKLQTHRIKKLCIPTTCNVVGRTRTSGLQGEGKVKEKQKRIECLWMNYSLP